jgi:PAS domain S-box-containing protein
MKLRQILMILSLLTFVSATAGGFLYYSALKDAAVKDARRQAVSRLALIKRNLAFFLAENKKPVRALAGTAAMLNKLIHQGDLQALESANAILDHYKQSLEVDVCYLMNHQGVTVASSNRDAPDSFVGKNFAFRPYFQQAFHSAPATYLALGTTSGKRGVYYSYPVFEKGEDIPIGLAVIKASIEQIEKELALFTDERVLVTDPNGIIFMSNYGKWLFGSIKRLTARQQKQVLQSRQFGQGPWPWIGLNVLNQNLATDQEGQQYQIHRTELDAYSGWQVWHLQNLDAIGRRIADPLIRITGPVVFSLCIFIGLAVLVLYHRASREIQHRKSVEAALRQSETRYRDLYHNTPAMLHSIDKQGRLVSVSEYWAEALGYSRQEVIGQKLTRFLTSESGRYAEQTVFPAFFRQGFCKDIPYRYVKKDGQTMDVLLSAIADRDTNGNIVRTLAVSIDVTERNRAEAALKTAKEKLSLYSKDLERQVRHRTSEISSILKHTPAVVYMKAEDGRYTLVNSRFETLFGLGIADVVGKTDEQLFESELAHQLRASDQRVLRYNQPIQSEEHFKQQGQWHTYLVVRFPVYNEKGLSSGLCGIATDITEVKKAQDQLRRLSGSIMANQEKERSALARELHDELGQVLTALRMDSVWLHENLNRQAPRAADRALSMCGLIDMTIKEVRSMAFRLRPGVLDDLGLVDALEWYTSDFERRTGIACIYEHSQIASLPETIATAAYRICQEALTNVARHSKATHVDVRLKTLGDQLTLAVEDDGVGFDLKALKDNEGLGVAGMRERAVLAGGALEVGAGKKGGTQVVFEVTIETLTLAAV